MKKKLLVFSQSNVGGAERMAVTVTKSLPDDEFEVVYYLIGMTSDGNHPLKDFIPTNHIVNIIEKTSALRLIAKLFKILWTEKPDIVFSSTLYINTKLLLLKCFFSKPKFVIRCENYLYTFTSKQQKFIKATYKRADKIIAQTEEMKTELLGLIRVPDGKIVVLHNPIDKETIDKKIIEGINPYSSDGKLKFVASGRFTFQKGFDMLIDAFAIVHKLNPNTMLHIVGENKGKNAEYCKVLEDKVGELGIKECVFFDGFQTNPYIYYKYADSFVLSSRWEGLPNVLIESLYLGTPVAAMKCIPIIQRIVSEGKNGYLAEKDDVKGLADAMLNSVLMGRVTSTYKSSSIQDFYNIFSNSL